MIEPQAKSIEDSMMKSSALIVPILLLSFLAFASGYTVIGFDDPLNKLVLRAKQARGGAGEVTSTDEVGMYTPVTVGDQGGLMEADKIVMLPGQPEGVGFDQYSGYVTVDPEAGRALFYYFTEAPEDPATKPLLLWLNGGPGCSSFGAGAMMELGPFRVNSDGRTLSFNNYSWNKVANIIFLESPAGVGYSYSNKTSDYDLSGDARTAHDSYTFLINWLERFPHYKTRDFYIAGESYAGHYVPQLAHKILVKNRITNQTVIKLRGIALGNALIDVEATWRGRYDFYLTHALISDKIHEGITLNCNFSSMAQFSDVCGEFLTSAYKSMGDIYSYDIYSPLCKPHSPTRTIGGFDPCSAKYINSYLNLHHVQQALHANLTSLPYPWIECSSILKEWRDSPMTVLPTIKQLMENNIRVWIYSGDTDGVMTVTSTRYTINTFDQLVNTSWYPWYTQGEVGGYAVCYQKFTFVTVRGAGLYVPSYQPARALTLFSSFLDGRLPPRS